MKNQHANAIPAETVQQAHALLTQAAELLAPYTLALTPEERHDLLKMGDKTLAFVDKAHQLAQQNPTLYPPYLDMAEFDIDFADAHNLLQIRNLVSQINDAINDTVMVAGSEAYQAALVFYSATKTAAAQDIVGAKAVYEALKARFPARRKSANTTTTD